MSRSPRWLGEIAGPLRPHHSTSMEHLRADQARQLALKPADARIDKRFEGVDQELVGLKAGLTALEIAVGRPGPAASIAFCPGVTSSTERVRAVLNAIVMS